VVVAEEATPAAITEENYVAVAFRSEIADSLRDVREQSFVQAVRVVVEVSSLDPKNGISSI
jgi:hypothetical protein